LDGFNHQFGRSKMSACGGEPVGDDVRPLARSYMFGDACLVGVVCIHDAHDVAATHLRLDAVAGAKLIELVTG
jgi:hypothetical protein